MKSEYVWVGAEYRLLKESEKALIASGRKSLKTNGKSELVYIDSPDAGQGKGDNHANMYIPGRKRPTNYTAPKKKRRKK